MKFTCGYCGKTWDTVQERMKCEADCYEKKRKEEARDKEIKKAEDRKNDSEAISSLVEQRNKLDEQIKDAIGKYNKKYNRPFECNFTPLMRDLFFRF